MKQFIKESIGNEVFLQYEVPAKGLLDEIALQSLSGKRIAGIVPLSYSVKGETVVLRYRITDMIAAQDALSAPVGKGQLIRMLRAVCGTLQRGEGLFLDMRMALLQPEYIFFDKTTKEPELIYLPIKEAEKNSLTIIPLLSKIQLKPDEDPDYFRQIAQEIQSEKEWRPEKFMLFLKNIKEDKPDHFELAEDEEAEQELSENWKDWARRAEQEKGKSDSSEKRFGAEKKVSLKEASPKENSSPMLRVNASGKPLVPDNSRGFQLRNRSSEKEPEDDPRELLSGEVKKTKGFLEEWIENRKQKKEAEKARKEEERLKKKEEKKRKQEKKDSLEKTDSLDEHRKSQRFENGQTLLEIQKEFDLVHQEMKSQPGVSGKNFFPTADEQKPEQPAGEQQLLNQVLPESVKTVQSLEMAAAAKKPEKKTEPEKQSSEVTSAKEMQQGTIEVQDPNGLPRVMKKRRNSGEESRMTVTQQDSDATILGDEDDTILDDEDSWVTCKAYLRSMSTGERVMITKNCFVIGRYGQPKHYRDGRIEQIPDYSFHTSDQRTSRRHAVILFHNGVFYIKDISTRHETWLNDQKLSYSSMPDRQEKTQRFTCVYPLKNGDVIRIRKEKFVFEEET